MIIINPKYDYLQEWINDVPKSFSNVGEIIYKARNEVRRVTISPELMVCVKRFKVPSLFQRLWYSFFGTSKALRAFQNALKITQRGISTPEPIACIIEKKFGLITNSYLITKQSTLSQTFYNFRDGNINGKEDLIKAFTKWVAAMHNAGVLHLDFSPGNILYDYYNNKWHFEIVDINRIRFKPISKKRGCQNFARLWGKIDFFQQVAIHYAQERHIPLQQCTKWILSERKKFWHYRSTEHFVNEDTFSVGVIISTYNNPILLEKVLWGLKYQIHQPNEIIVADDGSDERTAQLIQHYAQSMPIKYVWHPDEGFRKTEILNRAVLIANSDYLIFIDQDLIPRSDFISMHYTHAKKKCFISGGAICIPEELSKTIVEEDVQTGRLFSIKWLLSHGVKKSWKLSKLWQNKLLCNILNTITPTKASWNGGNASTWREYIIQVNGFDTRMRYGAEDREFGQRLENLGYKGIQLRYGTPLIHLYHTRPYQNRDDWKKNLLIWKNTKKHKLTTTKYGINSSI